MRLFKFITVQLACLNHPVLIAAGFALALVGCGNSEPSVFSHSAEPILEGRIATVKGACSLDSVAKKRAKVRIWRKQVVTLCLADGHGKRYEIHPVTMLLLDLLMR